MSRLAPLFTSLSPNWATDPDLYAALDREFGFDFDPCQINDGSVWDGTAVSWAGRRVFCNPPYGRGIGKWLAKGSEAAVAVFLVPSRTDTAWWHDYALKAQEIRFVRGRLKFSKGGATKRDGQDAAPFPSAIIVFRGAAFLRAVESAP